MRDFRIGPSQQAAGLANTKIVNVFKIKKALSIFLVVGLCASITACASEAAPPSSQSAEQPTEVSSIEGAEAYANLDTSEPVNLIWYAIGDTPPDLDLVFSEANTNYFQPVLNATMEMKFMSWSEYSTKYSLILAGGEDCDMIYTAAWCYFLQEAQKGAFYPLTEEFRETYMPLATKNQAPESWEQVTVGGEAYAVTRNYLTMPNYKFMAIRKDLRQKYNLPEVTDFDTFQDYMFAIAENEEGIQAIASPGNNDELRDILLLQNNSLYTLNQNCSDYVYVGEGDLSHIPDPDEVEYLYATDAFREYANLMKEWADKGVWSKNAINSTISTSDAFAQGQSGALPWIDSLFQYAQQLESAGLGTAEYIDITHNITPRKTCYNGDCLAITSTSKNPERAAMAIDFMMNNPELNILLYGGIEGKHYVLNEDGTYSEGPDAESYSWGNCAWSLINEDLPQKGGRDPRETALIDDIRAREKDVPIDSFVFDETPVKAEIAVLVSLREEYRPSFDLGVFGEETEAKLDEYMQKQKDAGLEKVMDEFRTQYGSYLTEKGLA